MPLLASNFASNSLQGTVSVENGFANINLQVEPFALEGNKTFVIKLRKDSFSGTVIGTSSPITITDTSTVTAVTANVSSIAEGNLVQFTVTTTNVTNNANLFFSVLPRSANITSSDFTANTGMVTIVNNTGTFALQASADLSLMDETGETFAVQMRTNSPTGNIVFSNLSNVTILDVSKGINVYSFVESASTVGEGTPITLTVGATNFSLGTVFYWNTEGNTTVSTFTEGNTGSFVMNSYSNTITLTPVGVPYSTTQNFNVKLRAYSNTSSVIATSNNLIVVDVAIAYINATGGTITDSGGYRTHAFTSSGNLVVTSTGGAGGTVDYLIVAGGGGGGGGGSSGPAPALYTGGGGGGAGGLLLSNVSVNIGNTVIVVGAGGNGSTGYGNFVPGGRGSNTSIAFAAGQTLVSSGGGGGSGGDYNPPTSAQGRGSPGGSGGGTALGLFYFSPATGYGLGTPGQGYPGGVSSPITFGGVPNDGMGAGGGGAGGQGSWNPSDPTSAPTSTIKGGEGLAVPWAPPSYGTSGPAPGRWFAGGGGGGGHPVGQAYIMSGGSGGGGAGGMYNGYPTSASGSGAAINAADSGANAIVNTGGGGGGVGSAGASTGLGRSGQGGSGIVLIRYPFVAAPNVTSVTSTSTAISVGANITFTINTTNANLVTLYYTTVGNVNTTNFIGGNSGSFVANATGAVITLQANTNIPLNESRVFALQIRQDSSTGYLYPTTSANVEIFGYGNLTVTGGNQILTANGYTTHIFLSSNTFNVTRIPQSGANVEYLIVAGGGGGAVGSLSFGNPGGAGGAGGLLTGNTSISAQSYSITVGASGAAAPDRNIDGANGGNSIALGVITSGGGGGTYFTPNSPGLSFGNPGGSGGGTGGAGGPLSGGLGTSGQGNRGGNITGSNPFGSQSSGGGGAGGAGADFVGASNGPRDGGIGLAIPWVPSSYGTDGPSPGRWFAGGGGGSVDLNTGSLGSGGAGGGGRGARSNPNQNEQAFSGNVNTGGGGGGGTNPGFLAGSGGSGIVIIRYPS